MVKNHKTPHCGQPPHPGLWCKIWCWILNMIADIRCFFRRLISKPTNKKKNKIKVAFVSVYGIPCGISTYNEEMLEELRNFVDVRVFAEYADSDEQEQISGDPNWVIRCWSRKRHPKRKLLKYIDEWKPDIVHIGHEYGFFPKAHQFTSLISSLKMRNYKIVSTLHSVYEHLDKTVSEACLPYIIVHSLEAKKTLEKKGIIGNVFVIPHGVKILAGTNENPELLEPYWNHWGSQYTIFQPGFLFDYKGHVRMANIVARLKEKYPDIHYVIQGSENPFTMDEHTSLYRKLIKIAGELDILDNITINRGFCTLDVLLSYIRTVKCCVLPYAMHPDHDVKGASGIANIVINTMTPLVTSNVHLFDGLSEVATICGSDNEIYDAIDAIFVHGELANSQAEARKIFLQNNNWNTTAQKISDIYKQIIA